MFRFNHLYPSTQYPVTDSVGDPYGIFYDAATAKEIAKRIHGVAYQRTAGEGRTDFLIGSWRIARWTKIESGIKQGYTTWKSGCVTITRDRSDVHENYPYVLTIDGAYHGQYRELRIAKKDALQLADDLLMYVERR